MIDPAAAARWLGAPVEVLGPVGSGTSKMALRVKVGGVPAILSASPPGLATAHDLSREHRYLTRLAGTGVPVPAVLGFCPDPAVAGAPFLVTSELAGRSADQAMELDPVALAHQALDILATLHGLDIDGLDAPPGSYLERQVRRWAGQLSATPTAGRLGDLTGIEEWLLGHLPADEERRIVHGDYGFHNLLVTSSEVTAVLDWELATVGDPLADLEFFLKSWGPGRLSENPAQDAVALRPGAPDRAALEERYAVATGRRPQEHRHFYDVFGLWRSIGIQEGVHSRSGGLLLVAEVPAMVATAGRLADLTDHDQRR